MDFQQKMHEKFDNLNMSLKTAEQSLTQTRMTLEVVQADQKRKEAQLESDEQMHKDEKQKLEEKI